jgi:hypothetical protein
MPGEVGNRIKELLLGIALKEYDRYDRRDRASTAGLAVRTILCTGRSDFSESFCLTGGLAQLGERLHGMQEVRGSSPLSSTHKS